MLYLASELLAFFKKAILTILVSPPSDVVLYYFYFIFFQMDWITSSAYYRVILQLTSTEANQMCKD